jgi:hypothetical protein
MLRALIGVAAGLVAALPASAAPYLPKDDAVVLERLPAKASDPAMAELRQLRAAAASSPDDPDAAGALARRYFEMAMAEGDPRYVGYADSALRKWRDDDTAPPELLVLRGLLRQYRHDFAGGLEDLARALRADPQDAEAHAWRAAIFMVQADYGQARRECEALQRVSSALHATACATYVEATTGSLRPAYERLEAALAASPDAGPGMRQWALTRLAEMAWRLGDGAAAERHFKDGIALGTDNFLLAAYADFLLEQNRPADVVQLLKDWVRADTLLLRLAIAEQRLKLEPAEAHARTLGERFAEAALRGEKLHLQEEARYLLELRGDARAALAAASENWKSQREPRDAGILLEAALAAREPAAAAPAIEWLEASRFENRRYRELAARIKALKP